MKPRIPNKECNIVSLTDSLIFPLFGAATFEGRLSILDVSAI